MKDKNNRLMHENFDNYEEEEFSSDILDEIEGHEEEAMYNGYLLITGRADFNSLLDSDRECIWLPFNPRTYKETPQKGRIIKMLIEYFETTEEYEKCQELLDLK